MINTNIPLYGICIVIGIILGLYFIYRNSNIITLPVPEKYILILYIFIGSIFGAKYYTYLMNHNEYVEFDFLKLGLSSYGAVIGVIIILIIYSLQYKISFRDIMYILCPSLPLMYGIGKIGCFLAGCCHGIKYTGPFHIIYKYSLASPNNVELFPVQLLEAIIFIGIFIFLNILINKIKNKNKFIGISFILCGLAKFLCDFLRASHNGVILSSNQIVSIIFMMIGIALIVIKPKSRIK